MAPQEVFQKFDFSVEQKQITLKVIVLNKFHNSMEILVFVARIGTLLKQDRSLTREFCLSSLSSDGNRARLLKNLMPPGGFWVKTSWGGGRRSGFTAAASLFGKKIWSLQNVTWCGNFLMPKKSSCNDIRYWVMIRGSDIPY